MWAGGWVLAMCIERNKWKLITCKIRLAIYINRLIRIGCSSKMGWAHLMRVFAATYEVWTLEWGAHEGEIDTEITSRPSLYQEFSFNFLLFFIHIFHKQVSVPFYRSISSLDLLRIKRQTCISLAHNRSLIRISSAHTMGQAGDDSNSKLDLLSSSNSGLSLRSKARTVATEQTERKRKR